MKLRSGHHFCTESKSLLLIAPEDAKMPASQAFVTRSQSRHAQFISQVQRLRGKVYKEDGAISSSMLSSDGRHVVEADNSSWHLVLVNTCGEVLGCTRFRQHQQSASFHDLCLRNSGLARCKIWGAKLKEAVSADMSDARKLGLMYVEVGGWAISREIRGTSEALRSVLAIFAWSQLMGGAIGVSTATERNSSASILKRLGGRPMTWNQSALPQYYDDQYKCGMEVLRFDSRFPNPRYANAIEEIRHYLSRMEIVQAAQKQTIRLSFNVPFGDMLPNVSAGSSCFDGSGQ